MSTERSLRISEIFESIQGEGISAGAPSTFLRLAVCNLRCQWCDTRYTWDWTRYRYEEEVVTRDVADVGEDVVRREPRRLVVTGGEPLLQARALESLLTALPRDFHVEVETNGTLAPPPLLEQRVDQWNVSPKLANSGEPRERRLRPHALLALLRTDRAWLKVVVESERDATEVEALIDELEWPRHRVLVMPQASTRAELHARAPIVTRIAAAHALRISPRLHVEKWDGRRGV